MNGERGGGGALGSSLTDDHPVLSGQLSSVHVRLVKGRSSKTQNLSA